METQNLEFKFNQKSTLIKVIEAKEEIAIFCKSHERRPSIHSKTKKERELAIKLRNYTSPNYLSFDPVFTEIMNNFPTTLQIKRLNKLNKYIKKLEDFIKKHKRKPSKFSSNSKELKLYQTLILLGQTRWLSNLKFMTREQKIKIVMIKSSPTYQQLKKYERESLKHETELCVIS
jgi:hypothetical protein